MEGVSHHLIQQLGTAFECNLGQEGQEFERTNLQKLKCPKGYSGVAQGVLKLRTDGRIDHRHKVNAKNISKKMA